jgi:hypothetical protein
MKYNVEKASNGITFITTVVRIGPYFHKLNREIFSPQRELLFLKPAFCSERKKVGLRISIHEHHLV